MNDILDQLERDNFFNADVFILPPENGESDGDSENSDDEQSVARPFADHFTPQILKGEGSSAFIDEGGCHVLESQTNEDGISISADPESTNTEQPAALAKVGTKEQLNKKQGRSKRSRIAVKEQPKITKSAEPTAADLADEVACCLPSATSKRGKKRQAANKKSETLKRSKAAAEKLDTEISPQARSAAADTGIAVHDSLPRVWKKADLNAKEFDKFRWNGNVSTAGNLPDLEPSGYFELFWDNELFEKIQNFSKLYATQEDPTSSFDVTVDELKVVVGILLISGYNIVPRRRLYWSSETDVRNDMIAMAMSRNRFDEILSKLHCATNEELPQSARLDRKSVV